MQTELCKTGTSVQCEDCVKVAARVAQLLVDIASMRKANTEEIAELQARAASDRITIERLRRRQTDMPDDERLELVKIAYECGALDKEQVADKLNCDLVAVDALGWEQNEHKLIAENKRLRGWRELVQYRTSESSSQRPLSEESSQD